MHAVALAIAALVFVLPASVEAQRSHRNARIGTLCVDPAPGSPGDPGFYQVFTAAMRDLGFDEGRNLVVEARFANANLDDLARIAEEIERRLPTVFGYRRFVDGGGLDVLRPGFA